MRNRTISTLSISSAAGLAAALTVAAPAFAQAPAPAASPAPAAPAAAAPAAAAPAAPATTITGYLEANYTANFNNPQDGINSFQYNDRSGQFAMNLADVRVARASSDTSRVGFKIRLIDGEAASEIFGDNSPHVLEGYGELLIPVSGKDVTFDAGQFVTHVGYETVEVGSDNFFSKSYLFSIPEPVYEDGIRATYPITPVTTIGGYLYNTYNGKYSGSEANLSPGFSIAFAPPAGLNVTLNGLFSRADVGEGSTTTDESDGAVQEHDSSTFTDYEQQSILNLILSDQFTKSFKAVVEGVDRFGKGEAVSNDNGTTTTADDSGSYTSAGAAVYLIYTLASGDNIALRGEEYSVSKGDVVPVGLISETENKPSIGSGTISYEPVHLFKNFPNVRTLIEYRTDFSNTELFENKSGALKKNESAITLGEVYSF